MNMNKKLISLLLVLMLAVGSASALVSCDKGGETAETGSTQTTETVESTEGESAGVEGDTESDTNNDESDTEPEGGATCEHPYAASPAGHWKPACSVCGKKDGKVQAHEYEERVEDEGDVLVYALRCTVCKYRAYEQEVPYEINSFYSAGELAYTDTSGSLVGNFAFDAGVGYASYSHDKGGSVTVVVLSNGEIEDPSGNYLVMKVRMAKSQSSFSASIKSVGANDSVKMNFSGIKSGWTTIIVDITKAVKDGTDKNGNPTKLGYQPDASGEYYLGSFSIAASAGVGESFDIGYVMFCDSLEDALNFTAGDKTVITYDDVLNKGGSSDQKECVDENGNPIEHKFIVNDDGTHTLLETCYQCGLAAVENEPHTYAQMIIDGEYTYACSACSHSLFGANINKYFSSTEINEIAPTYFRVNKLGITEDPSGFDYMSFSGQGNTAQIIFARNSSVASDLEMSRAFTVGNANFFVIRLRTNAPSVSFAIQFGTEGENPNTFRFPVAMAADGWATYVLDLAAVIPDAYKIDSLGEYLITNFYMHIGSTDFTPEVIYDVDFMAFVDDWEEVGALTPDDKVVNVTGANAGGWATTVGRQCVGEHGYTVISENGKHVVKCGACGYVLKTYEVEGAKTFYPAETLASMGNVVGGLDRTIMQGENGASFVRLDNAQTNGKQNGNWLGWSLFNSSTGIDIGRYMVIRIRIGDNGLGQGYFKFYTGTSQSVVSEEQSIMFKVSEDDQWHTIVIDLRTRIANPDKYMIPNENGEYIIKAMQLRPFSNNQPGAQADDYTDIEYIAFFDSLDDLKNIIAEEKYEWSVDASTSPVKNVTDHSCYTHTLVEKIEGTLHTVQCESCKTVIKSFTVSEGIAWYLKPSKMVSYSHKLEKFLYDEEADVVFHRYSGSGGNHLNITGGNGAGTADTEAITMGRYFVMKYRATADEGTAKLKISSNGVVGNELSADIGIRGFTSYHKDWAVVVIDLSELSCYSVGETGNLYVMITISGNYTFDVAYAAIANTLDDVNSLLEDGESYVDLGTSWATNAPSGGDEGGNEGGNEGSGDEGGTTPTPPPVSEHSITEKVTDGENGAKVYTYTCSHCEINVTKVVPASVLGYLSASKLGNSARVYYNIASHKLESENGVAFSRITGNDGTAQVLWNRVQADCDRSTSTGDLQKETSIDIGQAKYLVIRARTNTPSQKIEIVLSTTGYNAPTATSVTGNEGKYNINGGELKIGDEYATAEGYTMLSIPFSAANTDEWAVYVIDLSSVAAKYFVKDSETGTYVIDTFYFHITGFASTAYIDTEYVAFVENWADIDAIVEEESLVNVVSSAGAYSIVKTLDGSCAKHAEILRVVDGKYVVECSACGERIADYGIKTDAVGGIITAESLLSGGNVVGTMDRNYFVEDGVPFVRIDNITLNVDNWNGLTVINGDTKDFVGQYMVLKIRIGENGLGQTRFTCFASTVKGALTSKSQVDVKSYEDGEWHIIVVDLSQRIADPANYFTAEDGSYYVRYLQLRPFSGAQPQAKADDYMDISYIAFCDSLSDLKDIVGESYELSISDSSNVLMSSATGECLNHVITESVSGNQYTYTCSACKNVVKTVSVSSGVTVYYSANGVATGAGVYYNVNGGNKKCSVFSDASGEVFARINGNNGKASQIIFMRDQPDFTNETNANLVGVTRSVGEAKYLVIKIRTNDVSEDMQINISTTGKNGAPDGDDANTFPDSVGYKAVNIPLKAVENDGWATYVIDLETLFPEHYIAVDGEYVIDTLYMHFETLDEDSTVDVAFIAFAETQNDVNELGEGSTVVNITTTGGQYNIVPSNN